MEVFEYGSGVMLVDESALEWSKMSDDSDSEMEELFVGGCGLYSRLCCMCMMWCPHFQSPQCKMMRPVIGRNTSFTLG